MRIHLFFLSALFLVCYIVFLYLYTTQLYVNTVLDLASERYDAILSKRLLDSSIALSTVVYNIDKVGIDSVLRLADVFARVKTEVEKGYFIGKNTALPNYKLFH
jgi:hypothetical protein